MATGLIAVAAGLLAASCGGGGAAQSNSNQGGVPQIGPDGATFYAGIPATLVIAQGRAPFTLTSSEPSVFPLPVQTSSRTIDVIPANPGVIDANLPADSLPIRTVTVTVRDANGNAPAPIQVKIGRNFLTGYGVSFTSTCPSASGTTPPPACSGGETVVTLRSITNGNLFGNRAVRFEVIKGNFQFEQFPDRNVLGNTVTTTTDHSGTATAIFRVNVGAGNQFGVLRVVDVATGVYVDEVFPISANGAVSTLTAIPNSFTFTGPLQGICGTGSASFVVLGGTPPYTVVVVSDPNLTVTPTVSNENPGRFTVTANNSSVCISGGTIVITDSTGATATITVNTAQGTATIPSPSNITVAPSQITLVCGTSGSVSVVGGTGNYFVQNSTHPRVTAVVSGNTVTITRLSGDTAPPGPFPTTGTVSISDGFSIGTVDLSVPAFCP